jgi:uroporphyrinogen decarboxylase
MPHPEPNWDRIVTTCRFEEPDRVPLMDIVTPGLQKKLTGSSGGTGYGLGATRGGSFGSLDETRSPLEEMIQNEIDFRIAHHYDFIWAAPDVDFHGGHVDDSLVTADVYSGESRQWANLHSGLITSWADFEKHPWPTPADVNYAMLDAAEGLVPDGMKVIGARGHIFTEVWELMGMEAFAFGLYDAPDLIEALFDKVAVLVLNILETLLDYDSVGAIRFNDDLGFKTGLLMPPWVYRKWLFPRMREAVEMCHQRDKLFLYHCDGNVSEVWDDLMALDIDIMHPIDPSSLDIREVRRITNGRLALCGNISQAFPLAFGSPADVRLEALRLLRDIGPGGGYLLGSGHSCQDYLTAENYLSMVNTAIEYGRYPIDIPDAVIVEAEAEAERSTKHFDLTYDNMPQQPQLARFYDRMIT